MVVGSDTTTRPRTLKKDRQTDRLLNLVRRNCTIVVWNNQQVTGGMLQYIRKPGADFLVGITLSRDETLDLHLQVQAPVASRNDIIAYIQTISSEWSKQYTIRSGVECAVTTAETRSATSQHMIEEAPLPSQDSNIVQDGFLCCSY